MSAPRTGGGSRWQQRIEALWYARSAWSWPLLPLAALFCSVVALRRAAYRAGWLQTRTFSVPVIVVGNLTAGGTGKTPLVIWMAEFLRRAGYRPGIVSRGYGGTGLTHPQAVTPDSDPALVGDEALLLARRSGCPMMVGRDRAAAVASLLSGRRCDLVISDDGLQHYGLGRDIEVAVVDGARRLGNRWCLPAGPLREPPGRLGEVDLVVCNGQGSNVEYSMRYNGDLLLMVNGTAGAKPLADLSGQRVHAVAGIGHPERFFATLRQSGLELISHAFPDHYRYRAADIRFADELLVLMTEKDAVKCQAWADTRHWYLPIAAELDPRLGERLLTLLMRSRHGQEIA
jgi:tetraacyldisaccharide 4'-kinase